jgi:hypothetical protein
MPSLAISPHWTSYRPRPSECQASTLALATGFPFMSRTRRRRKAARRRRPARDLRHAESEASSARRTAEHGRQRGALGLGHRHLVNESFESKERRHSQKLLASAFAELAGHREIVTCSDPFVGRQTNVPRKAVEMLDERGHQLSHTRIARLRVASDDFVGNRLFARSRRRCAFARRRPRLFALSSGRRVFSFVATAIAVSSSGLCHLIIPTIGPPRCAVRFAEQWATPQRAAETPGRSPLSLTKQGRSLVALSKRGLAQPSRITGERWGALRAQPGNLQRRTCCGVSVMPRTRLWGREFL